MRNTWCALLVATLAGCDQDPQLTQVRGANAQLAPAPEYVISTYGSLGGRLSRGIAIDPRGTVAGWSNLPGDTIRVASMWRDSVLTPLGTLPGGISSSVQWPGLSNNGMIVGISEIAQMDTLNEDWSCESFIPSSGRMCRGFFWENGTMQELPTLGGNQGFATGVNSSGQVVGWAETAVLDPTCNAPQKLGFKAVMWEPRAGRSTTLEPFGTDAASAATAINESGVVVGISGDCDVAVGNKSARRAVMWTHGVPQEIGNLGGEFWHTPMAVNDRGHVVGFSNPTGVVGGALEPHGFLWTPDTIIDIKPLDGNVNSQALGINGRGQVVGISFGGTGGTRGFLWENGRTYNLNLLLGAGFLDRILSAQHINDAGQITGRLLNHLTGEQVTFVATPVARGR